MHLSPDEIERRTFAIEDRGYDRDQVRDFLLEVASGLRLSLHTTRPPSPAAARPPTTAPATGAADPPGPVAGRSSSDDFARLGSEVAEVLRAAHDAVASLHEQADREIEARQIEAAARADDLRRQAEADAAWTQDRAKRVLITAQEQADAIVAEAETTAAELVRSARRQAKDHAEQVATRTRRHAEQILRAEREALRRLHQAKAGVAAAVEMLTGSETRPVVDLTELRPNVRLGSISVEIAEDPTDLPTPALNDPLARMIRSAVDRAAAHAQELGSSAADSDAPETPTGAGDPSGPGGPADRADRPDPRVTGTGAAAASRRSAPAGPGGPGGRERRRAPGIGGDAAPDADVDDPRAHRDDPQASPARASEAATAVARTAGSRTPVAPVRRVRSEVAATTDADTRSAAAPTAPAASASTSPGSGTSGGSASGTTGPTSTT